MEKISPARTLVEQTYDSLLDAICAGEFKAGDRIGQDEVAERLNVSRQPVNSAIAMLKAQRFLIDTGRRGVVVAPVDRTLFEAIYQVRSAIEPLAVELATPRLDAAAIARGRAIVEEGSRGMQRGDTRSVLLSDIAFHMLICELSGNSVIVDTMRLNWQHLRRAMGEVLSFPGMTIQVWREHRRIFEAMVAGDGPGAAAEMRAHVAGAPRRVLGAAAERSARGVVGSSRSKEPEGAAE